MVTNFPKAFAKTFGHEGVYSNHPDDRGGETFCGISRRHHPQLLLWRAVDAAKSTPGFPVSLVSQPDIMASVRQFYLVEFWNKASCDRMGNQQVAEAIFDAAVNMGLSSPIRFLQRALNALNRQGTLYPNLRVDGVFGPKTESALIRYLKTESVKYLLKSLSVQRGAYYLSLVESDETQEPQYRGWIERA